jgi:hypothetical protein
MTLKEHYLFLECENSIEKFPMNSAHHFTIELPSPLLLEGDWVMGVIKLAFWEQKNFPSQQIYFCSNAITEQIIGDRFLPVLNTHRTLKRSTSKYIYAKCSPVIYLPVSSHFLERITLYITCKEENPIPVARKNLWCVLHLKKSYNYANID